MFNNIKSPQLCIISTPFEIRTMPQKYESKRIQINYRAVTDTFYSYIREITTVQKHIKLLKLLVMVKHNK